MVEKKYVRYTFVCGDKFFLRREREII